MALFIYAGLFVLLLLWGGFLAWRWKETRAFASEFLALRIASNEIPADVSPTEFTPLFLASEGPRRQTYFFICAAIVLVTLPLFASVFNAIWGAFWAIMGYSPVFEVGTLIHTFSMFLGFIAFVVGILAISLRRYYVKMPPSLKHVLRDLHGEQI